MKGDGPRFDSLLGLSEVDHAHGEDQGQCPACVLATCAGILSVLLALDTPRRDRLLSYAEDLMEDRHREVVAAAIKAAKVN